MRIPKGVSQPADQDCPSLLTTLPPEIRNEVYRWLLVREEPIIYDGCRSDREREPSFDRDYQFDRYYDYDEMESSRELSQEELTILRQPSHDIGSCVPLLRSCRQIYFEAVGILYSANSFLISANPYQHNEQMTQIFTAAEFLMSLGSQLYLLKKLVIDITPLCPTEAGCVDGLYTDVAVQRIDVLPLLRVLWSQPKVARIISLASTERNLDRRVHPHFHQDDLVHNIQPLFLDEIIRALGCDNTLGIMSYARFERLLSRVYALRLNVDGWFTRCLHISCTPSRKQRSLTLSISPLRLIQDLWNSAGKAWCTILNYACFPEISGIEFEHMRPSPMVTFCSTWIVGRHMASTSALCTSIGDFGTGCRRM
jgi:hypothetical protein